MRRVSGKWIYFDLLLQKPKTQIWQVMSKEGKLLGDINWFGRWRKYAFFPEENTVYENICLAEIANFISQLMEERKRARK